MGVAVVTTGKAAGGTPSLAGELALLAVLATLWGASYTFIKVGVATIPPVTLIAARTAIAGALLLAVMRASGVPVRRDVATWRLLLVQACLNSVLPFTLIAWAEREIDAGLAAILNSTTPVFAFLITFAVTRHEPAPPAGSSASRPARPEPASSSARRRWAASAATSGPSSRSWRRPPATPGPRSSGGTSRA